MAEPEVEDEIVTVALDSNAWIRVTVLISFAVSVVGILTYLLSGGGRELFERKVTLRTFVADATGLENEALVEVDGIKVGKIQSVELSHSNEPSRVVLVKLSIDQRYLSSIPVDSRTEITADNLLGDKYINIHKGRAHEALKAGDELFTQPPSNNFNPADLISSLQEVLNQVSTILDLIDDPDSQLGQLFQTEAIYDQIRNDIVGIDQLVHQAGNPKTPAGQAVFGSELYERMRAPILNIDKQLAAIQRGEGPMGHAFATDEQYETARKQIAEFRKSVEDLRKNEYLTSDEKYRGLVALFKQLNVTVASLANGPMFDSSQTYESLNGSLKGAESFLREFRNNPKKFMRIKVF